MKRMRGLLIAGMGLALAAVGQASETIPSRTTVLVGPLMRGTQEDVSGGVSLGARYRLTGLEQRFPLYAELGALAPLGRTKVGDQKHATFGSVTDTASLKLHFQFHAALIAAPRLGNRTDIVPEVGAGAALTSSEISYTSSGGTGDRFDFLWSPYLHAGLRFFADRKVSMLVNASYTIKAFDNQISIAAPPHSQTFDFPSGFWTLGCQLAYRFGR